MVIKQIIITAFALIFSFSSLFAQQTARIKKSQDELSKIKSEINSLQEQLSLKTRKEKESFDVLENYNRQSYLLHSVINNLIAEEKAKEVDIAAAQGKISGLKSEISSLKKNYAKYVVAVYKRGKADEWASVLDADSFEQALLRYKYLKYFSQRREADLRKLKIKTEALTEEKALLEKEKKEKLNLTAQKQDEQSSLDGKRTERRKILAALRNDKNALKSEIAAKKKAEVKISDLISKLIVQEELRRKAEEARLALAKAKAAAPEKTVTASSSKDITAENKTYDVNLSTAGFSSFAALKGRLNWPVQSGRIVRKFGENRNQKLNTVTLNYGIDIKTTPDAEVKAVADGVVSAIDWLPGYGSVVIVTHKGEYRTVYSHLSDIFVKEGERLKTGSIIGRVGESLEGDVLHFEIWNSRDKQNPEIWLARR